MSEERKKTELELVAGLFRNTGKNESCEEFVMFRNSYWKEGASKPYFRVMKRVEQKTTTVED